MKAIWLFGLALLQVLVLAYMAGEREWVLRTGRTMYLRTAPVDPSDPMRGDYVRLQYPISRVSRAYWRGGLLESDSPTSTMRRDRRVYASLRPEEDGTGELVSLSTERPASGLYLRGRADLSGGYPAQVRYGLEAYFVEQGKGLVLERGRDRGGIQVPMEMKVAVSAGGLAVLQDHRWCALGIGLDLVSTNVAARDGRRQRVRNLGANIRLLNASSNPIAIVDRPGGRSFGLISESEWHDNEWVWSQENRSLPAPEAGEVILLQPGQTHTNHIAFDDPYWAVQAANVRSTTNRGRVNLADVEQNWQSRFRFEYRAPDRAISTNLPHAALIWHGRLPTRAFWPAGNVD